MSTVFIWIFIAIIGFGLYIAPLYLAKYTEGFVDMSTNVPVNMPGYINPDIQSTTGASISSIEDFLTNTPTFDDPESKPIQIQKRQVPPMPVPEIKTAPPSNTKYTPIGAIDAKSAPDSASISDSLGEFLEQGSLFKAGKNQREESKPIESTNTVPSEMPKPSPTTPSCPACPKQTCPPAPMCPPVQKCPPAPTCPEKQCPDLSNYIRKDQIPCWNCNLD